jgi:hypothetical protein
MMGLEKTTQSFWRYPCIPQFGPQQWDEGHTSRAAQADAPPATWPLVALICRSNRFLPHLGHAGFSSPRTSSSNSCLQSKHTYS